MIKLKGHTIVLADLNLPDGQSTAVLRKVQEMGWTIRVAIISGSIDGKNAVVDSGERPDAFFENPLDLDRLLGWVPGKTKSP